MRPVLLSISIASLSLASLSVAQPTSAPSTQPAASDHEIGATAKDVHPLAVGSTAPATPLLTPDAATFDLAAAYAAKPTVLVFYRGGWCPFCTRHLAAVGQVEPELTKLGYQVIAVSPDSPERITATIEKSPTPYALLSDKEMTLARAFGIAFRVDQETEYKYTAFGIDLTHSPDGNGRLLPVPSVFIVDTTGVIRFAHSNADYTKRLSGDDLLAAARAALSK